MAYEKAKSALRVFYDAAKTKLPFKSFDEMLTHYRTHVRIDGSTLIHDDFLEELEGAVRIASVETSIAMRNLANATPNGMVPKTQAFFKALSSQVIKLTASEFGVAVVKGLKQAGTVAAVGISAGVGVYIAIALGAVLLPQIMAAMAEGKK